MPFAIFVPVALEISLNHGGIARVKSFFSQNMVAVATFYCSATTKSRIHGFSFLKKQKKGELGGC
jgi:hypothetical protein